ncbi:MAG: helix-hairpin-helix domain-containing protein [Puniceicoccaceae bacterium]
MHEPFEELTGRKKKKVDIEALQSPLKRIPGMDISSVRDLLDIGITEIDELRGRSPEALLEEIFNLREQTPRDRLSYLRLAVYYAETDNPDPQLLEAWKWAEPSIQD